jgi:carbon storage regulator
MLVLSRKVGETIHLGDDIRITVAALQGNRIRIAIEAPEDVLILRGELATLKLNSDRAMPPLRARLGQP